MIRLPARSGAFREASPVLSLAMLLLLPIWLPTRSEISPDVLVRQQQVSLAMASLPYATGRWVGRDIEVPPAAVRLLHPNAILSRRYERIPNGPVVSVLMVHCSDSRDMLGHFPPVCYPSSGWSAEDGDKRRIVEVAIGEIPVTARVYRFTREMPGGRRVGIRIFNFFVLPDGTLRREMDDIYRHSEHLDMTVQGVAQVQVITSADLDDDEARLAVREILTEMTVIFETLGVGGKADDVETGT